ncbi:MAG: endonuclease [Woeseiaceae bacterium]|nr:endonuclease [Woeseiaceae bacterium]
MMTDSDDRQPARIRVVSYNVHSCVGADSLFSPARIATILAALDADFIALQEVEERDYQGMPVSQFLAETLGLCRAGRTAHKRVGVDYGNVLLSRMPPTRSVTHDLALARREPRGAIEADFELADKKLRVFATHFGLSLRERRAQLQKTLPHLVDPDPDLTVLCADFNEWAPYSTTHRNLSRLLGAPPSVRTFPSRFALLALDRIYASPLDALVSIRAVVSADARRASDHLPLVADFELD